MDSSGPGNFPVKRVEFITEPPDNCERFCKVLLTTNAVASTWRREILTYSTARAGSLEVCDPLEAGFDPETDLAGKWGDDRV
jgi:hypothetical protein